MHSLYQPKSEIRCSLPIDLHFKDETAIAVEASRICDGWYISMLKRNNAGQDLGQIIKSIDEREMPNTQMGIPANHTIIKCFKSDSSENALNDAAEYIGNVTLKLIDAGAAIK